LISARFKSAAAAAIADSAWRASARAMVTFCLAESGGLLELLEAFVVLVGERLFRLLDREFGLRLVQLAGVEVAPRLERGGVEDGDHLADLDPVADFDLEGLDRAVDPRRDHTDLLGHQAADYRHGLGERHLPDHIDPDSHGVRLGEGRPRCQGGQQTQPQARHHGSGARQPRNLG
jgi:hypothetical protein